MEKEGPFLISDFYFLFSIFYLPFSICHLPFLNWDA